MPAWFHQILYVFQQQVAILTVSLSPVADFREVIRELHTKYGSVHQLVEGETHTWKELVQPNACYIFQEVLQGLNYLYRNNIQHGDLKG